MANARRFRHGEAKRSAPRYELRVRPAETGRDGYEVWQVPSAATPQVQTPVRIAGLQGRNLELVQHRILRLLAEQRVRLVGRPGRTGFSRPVPGDARGAARADVPYSCTHARPGQNVGGGRRYREDGARGGGVLARYGDPPGTPETGARRPQISADRAGEEAARRRPLGDGWARAGRGGVAHAAHRSRDRRRRHRFAG